MDSELSCMDTPICLMPFARKKFSKKNNIYNIASGKILNDDIKQNMEDDNPYVKLDKYNLSLTEKNINLNMWEDDMKYVRSHYKLQNNLTKSDDTIPETSLDFINKLEENSKKIENIFSKCKKTSSLPSSMKGKDYENFKNALCIFLENEEINIESMPNTSCKEEKQTKKRTIRNHDYEHIKFVLKMMFGETMHLTDTKTKIQNLNDKLPMKSLIKKTKLNDNIKLQALVQDLLKTKQQNLHGTQNSNEKKNNFFENIRLRKFSVSDSSDSDYDKNTNEYNRKMTWKNTLERNNKHKENASSVVNSIKHNLFTTYEQLEEFKICENELTWESTDSCNDSEFSLKYENAKFEDYDKHPYVKVNTESSLSYGSTRTSLDHLDAILLQMRDVSEKRKELEKEQTETLTLLRQKQNELQWRTNCSASEKVKICETIEALQSKIRELEKKTELQNVKHEELLLEMAAIKRSSQQRSSLTGNYNISSWKKPSASNQEVQTSPESNASELTYLDRLTPSTSNSYDSGNIYESRQGTYRLRQHAHGCLTNIAPSSSFVDLHLASLDPSACYSINTNRAVACKSYWTQSQPPCTCPVSSDQELPSATPSNESACSDDSGIQNVSMSHNSSNITVDIDKIMAKIDQDNRILAELDKTRSTIATQGSMTAEQLRNISEMGIIPPASCQSMLPIMQQSTLPISTSQSAINHPMSLSNPLPAYLQQFELNNNIRTMGSMFPIHLQQPVSQSTFSVLQSNYQGNYSQLSANLLQSQFDLEGRNIKNGNIPGSSFASSSDLLLPHEDLVLEGHSHHSQDMIEIPGKGLCNIFISKYSYDPFSQSTNLCPEAELAINAGDYLLVYGEPDDDGYVEAELMDGRRGLVPIIFIQKLSGDELLEFNQRVLAGMKEGDDSASTTIPQDIENLTDEHGKKFRPEYNIGGGTEEEDENADESESDIFFSVLVPAPKQLTLERQLNKSILIRWNGPEDSPSHCIDSYHVYVDGVLKTTVKANERTKALLEGVDSNKPHRISIRSVTQNRRTSRDAACTMLIGKDVPSYPTNVKAHHVTATSSIISWMPSNSNFQHTVCVNNVEIRTVKPGVYRHTITGLVPNTVYRVTVRAKNIRAPQFDDKSASDKFASYVDFRTLPKGMPDPPSEIQVEVGPQDGTLLVTWLPVYAENSNGAPVTGYAVYADGKKVTDIDSPTGDHALIELSKIISLNPRYVTVRTKSKENQSCDSNATPIPSCSIKGRHHGSKSGNYRHQSRNAFGQIIIDPDENLSDKEIYPEQSSNVPAIEITKDNQTDENYSEEEFLETHQSNKNIRYGQISSRSHGSPRSHLDRGRLSSSNTGHERNLSRINYDSRSYDMRRENREYHHSPSRSMMDRRKTTSQHLVKYGRGASQQSVSSSSNRQHMAQSSVTPEDNCRIAVALFDYDPATMSPNPGTCHEELQFSIGDQIKILSEKDPDGFYWGECRGKRGYVPQNMITDLENVQKVNKHESNRYLDIRHSADARKMVALYDYDPHSTSPNPDADVEISFRKGQIIYVKGEVDDDGFYLGEVDGMQGLLPSNYVQEIEDYHEDAEPSLMTQGNRSTVRSIQPRERNRGHGPGARGPPLPPREGRNRRKDMRPLYENQQDQMKIPGRIDDVQHLEKRTGRELPNIKGDPLRNITRENNTGAVTSNMQNSDVNRNSFRTNRTRGTPHIVPEISSNTKSCSTPSNANTGLKFPESPNIMQKLSEITGNTENPVDNILSKGKELIFMKFGLGK